MQGLVKRDIIATPIGHGEAETHMCSQACHASATAAAFSELGSHNVAHSNVTCVACHDATHLPVTQNQAGKWVISRSYQYNDLEFTEEYQSHNLSKDVNCLKCHAVGNPWGLLELANHEN
jgi:hypothetical protein